MISKNAVNDFKIHEKKKKFHEMILKKCMKLFQKMISKKCRK